LDLGEVARRAVEQVQPFLGQRELMISTPGRPVYVDGDPVRLLQIISNLLHNAAKFTEAGGNLWLTIERSDKNAVIRVRDDGIGIVETQSQRIFEMFAQADTSIGRTQGGLGLGLTLVKRRLPDVA
jgi:two-component system, chemotaxis family, CheB/CheR fusion protein